jgi:superfamily II DNA or RNA helicase/HKD family nuclease
LSEKVQKNEGLYEEAVTEAVAEAVSGLIATMEQVTDPELRADLLSELVRSELFNLLRDEDKSSGPKSINVVNSILESIGSPTRLPASPHPQLLTSIMRNTLSDARKVEVRPRTPLRDLALLTNAKGEPGIGSELKAELRSADQIDILVSFIRLTGLRQVYEELKAANQRGARIRVVTSVYIGATEKKALDQLVLELGAEVKVDFEARHNRLHAKAWLFGRQSGFSTAYIGSSNMSSAAMTSGLEWNVRLSAAKSPHLLEKFSISFETYWASKDFVTYDPAVNGEQLEEALYRASGKVDNSGNEDQLSGLQINPWPYQQTMLDELQVSRDVHGHHENLVVAATGTGKTVLAAFDYKRQISTGGRYPKLLFVAHTKEILKQARRTFREILGDASFGEMLVDGEKPKTWDHVFASIQSLKSKLTEFSRDQFEFVIVDEFHHAEAPSYKRLLGALKPKELLGLTATPERGDDKSVQDLFGGRIASELRLWDALDQELLAPFHYFGIHEDTDYSHLDWSNGSYDRTQLSQLVTGNTVRDKLVLDQINRMVLNPKTMKCLVYCVSEQHSEYIAGLFSKHGIETVSVTQSTKPEVRADAVRNLSNGRIQAISSVNVFNEGLDIPSVDTIVMLRPTESPVVFIQQLGRGLRKSPGKEEVLVLDFVGAHRAEYRLDRKLQAMTGVPRGKLPKAIEDGFPFLPSGVFISLDRLSTEQVLAGVKAQVNPPRQKLLKEIAEIGATSLETFLELSGRELSEVYRLPGESWSSLCSAAGLTDPLELGFEVRSLLPSIKRFLHIDDPERIDHYSRFAEGKFSPWELSLIHI